MQVILIHSKDITAATEWVTVQQSVKVEEKKAFEHISISLKRNESSS